MNESLFLIKKTITLIEKYHFDLGGYKIRELIAKWSKIYAHEWLPLAVIEAIYQGRIKAVSVEQILSFWEKKGKVIKHFNSEFERLITFNLNLDDLNDEKIRAIFFDSHQGLKMPDFSNHYGLDEAQPEIEYQENIIQEEAIMNFQPLEDYSHCFHKLKSFVEDSDSPKKISFDDYLK